MAMPLRTAPSCLVASVLLLGCGPAAKPSPGAPDTTGALVMAPKPLPLAATTADGPRTGDAQHAPPTPAPCRSGTTGDLCTVESITTPLVQPFRQQADLQLRPARLVARTRLLARDAIGAEVSPDGQTVLVVGIRKGARLVPGGTIAGDYVHASRFSPDGRFVALKLGRGKMAVFEVATPRLLRLFRGARLPTFLPGGEVVVRQGCRVLRAKLDSLDPPQTVSSSVCGSLLFGDRDLRRWIVADRGPRTRLGTFQPHGTVWHVDLQQRRRSPLLRSDDLDLFISPLAAPSGNRVCLTRATPLWSVLECRTLAARQPEQIWRHGSGRLHDFDESGDQLLFEATSKTRRHSLLLADFASRSVRYVTKGDPLRWRFLPGGQRIVGQRGVRGVIIDLEQGWRSFVGSGGSQWEGFATVPGNPNRFIMGRERGGGRDLYWVEIPAGSKSKP